jgi:hypothetical protein
MFGYPDHGTWTTDILTTLIIGCFLALIIIPWCAGGYAFYEGYWKKDHFSKGDKVMIRFHGSPAVLSAVTFGWPQLQPLISNLSDQDRVDVSPCGGVGYFTSNGGLDFAQALCKCKEYTNAFKVKQKQCNPQSSPSDSGCIHDIAFQCQGGKGDCAALKNHGFTGKCNTDKGKCQVATKESQMPQNPVRCIPTGNSNSGTKGECKLFKSLDKCIGQMACCGPDTACGPGQKCVTPKEKYKGYCKNTTNKELSKLCCGGMGTYLVQNFPMRAEGEVVKSYDGNTYGVQWHAVKVMGGGNPEEECRFIRSDANKEAWDTVFGTPEKNPTGISNLVATGTTQGSHKKAWHLLSHKIDGKNLYHLFGGYWIKHKTVPGKAPKRPPCPARDKYKNCPARMPYVTKNTTNSKAVQCCARPPVCRSKVIPGTQKKKKFCICPDTTQCQLGSVSISNSDPFCSTFPWGGNKAWSEKDTPYKCPDKGSGEIDCPSKGNNN